MTLPSRCFVPGGSAERRRLRARIAPDAPHPTTPPLSAARRKRQYSTNKFTSILRNGGKSRVRRCGIPESTRRFAWESLNAKYGREAEARACFVELLPYHPWGVDKASQTGRVT